MNNEPKKYQAYLQEGFDLLKMNYSLLSYISALGAYRNKMAQLQQTTEFLSDFYPVAKKVLYALENIEKLRPEVFAKLQGNIEQSLKEIQLDDNQTKADMTFALPYQQLNLISQLLPQLYRYFQHSQKESITK